MAEKTITLRADLVEQLEDIASAQGRSVDDVLSALLNQHTPPSPKTNWALALAKAMAADKTIEWRTDK